MCPRCHTKLEDRGEWWSGSACGCGKCMGILADKNWLESNMDQGDYTRLRARVFTGSPAGILCPHCLTIHPQHPVEMSKFTVSPGGRSYEVDGCHNCGSMWFDQGELEPYEEGGAGDPSIVGARNKKDPVERMGDPINAGTAAGDVAGTAGEVGLGILDLLAAILTGF